MTVAMLIEELKKLDPKLFVWLDKSRPSGKTTVYSSVVEIGVRPDFYDAERQWAVINPVR